LLGVQKQNKIKTNKMKIIIDNVEFPFNEGCKLLKLKHGSNTESPFKEIEDFWNEIEPLTFKEIITTFNNLEQRRIALSYLGLENLSKEINSKLVSTETISKQTTWVNKDGVTETIKFEDKYELYSVDPKELGAPQQHVWYNGSINMGSYHYLKFKDTSTDREYLLWVDCGNIIKMKSEVRSNDTHYRQIDVDAIDAIAWTIQTNLKKGDIEKIIRQGDCILLKRKKGAETDVVRHLTSEEYRSLLVLES
jgi:hypothetical protein